MMMIYPSVVKEGTTDGLTLWYKSLLPSLLPYTILSLYILGQTDTKSGGRDNRLFRLVRRVTGISPAGSFACFTGFLCGYPLGAKIAGELTKSGRISRTEGQYLLSFVNNASPAFLLQFTALDMLGSPGYAPLLLGSVYGGALLAALLLQPLYRKKLAADQNGAVALHTRHRRLKAAASEEMSIGACILNACEAMIRLCGYLVLFSIIIKMVTAHTDAVTTWKAFLIGIIEITNGVFTLTGLSVPLPEKLALLSFCIAFGGICCLAQSAGMCRGSRLSMPLYLLAKLCCGLLAALLVLLYFLICPISR